MCMRACALKNTFALKHDILPPVCYMYLFGHQVLGGDSLLEVYRLLKQVEGAERDELTQAHAQAALGELDSVMRTALFPEPNTRPQKKITILN